MLAYRSCFKISQQVNFLHRMFCDRFGFGRNTTVHTIVSDAIHNFDTRFGTLKGHIFITDNQGF